MARPSNLREVHLCVFGGGVLGRRCPSFHAHQLLVFKSPPGGPQSFDELLMKEPGLTINFPRVIICCFGNNSLKTLNTHLASQWLKRALG
jgi:hypothetical protein